MSVSMFYKISVVLWVAVVIRSWAFLVKQQFTVVDILGGVFMLLGVLALNQWLGVLTTYKNYPQGLQKWKISWGVPGFVGIYMVCVTMGAVLAHYFPN